MKKKKSSTKIKIFHAGQVGGNVTLIKTKKTTIMIDFGTAFSSSRYGDVKYDFKKHPVDGVFFTHYHFDHVGRFDEIPTDTMIYTGEVTREIIKLRAPVRYNRSLQRFRTIAPGEIIKIGDIKIRGILSDHSAFASYMYLIETSDRVILHTGDFRFHGYNGFRLINRIKKICENENIKIDTLIIEGTRVLDVPLFAPTVEDMEKKATKIFKKHKFAYIYVSPYDFESVVAFYQAAGKNGMDFYMDEDMYEPVRICSDFGKKFDYRYDLRSIKIGAPEKCKSTYENGFVYIIRDDERFLEHIYGFRKFEPIFIFSERLDYIIKPLGNYKEKIGKVAHGARLLTKKFYYLHTSGHGDRKCLKKMIKAIEPKEVIPIHSKHLWAVRLLK